MITRTDIEAAAQRIAGYIRITPVIELEKRAWDLPANLSLKLETMQHTGSFKPRGAFNRLLSHSIPPTGVIAASGGNHGLAVAYVARQLGHRAEIFVPELCPPTKIERLHRYEANVTVGGANYAEAYTASQQRAAQTGALVVHAYDQPEVVTGQGTLGRELAQQLPEIDTVLVAVGGGGLISGVAAWFAGDVRVIGVEPQGAPTLARALAAGQPVDVEVQGVAVDSLGARRIGTIAFEIAQRYIERVVLVDDQVIQGAQRLLWDQLRIVAEPGGATAAAALLSGSYQPAPGERIAVVICGANTDPGQLG
ncbi:MAG TPA: threonine/serine dehydratase [Ktedonobacteraceae bacterium]|jgi:threonine dehydratase|nr:threonine/serine dehydratase [Ktedonobacteraceae bacterium]